MKILGAPHLSTWSELSFEHSLVKNCWGWQWSVECFYIDLLTTQQERTGVFIFVYTVSKVLSQAYSNVSPWMLIAGISTGTKMIAGLLIAVNWQMQIFVTSVTAVLESLTVLLAIWDWQQVEHIAQSNRSPLHPYSPSFGAITHTPEQQHIFIPEWALSKLLHWIRFGMRSAVESFREKGLAWV